MAAWLMIFNLPEKLVYIRRYKRKWRNKDIKEDRGFYDQKATIYMELALMKISKPGFVEV